MPAPEALSATRTSPAWAPPPGALPANGTAAADKPNTECRATRRIDSATLFGDLNEIEIEHGPAVYRLRLTALGKLILTK